MSKLLFSLLGNSQALDGGAMFGNAPKALWQAWIASDEQNRIPLACRAMLVRDGSRNILFETGIGAFFEPKLRERFGVCEANHVLLESLAAEGLSESDIDVVVLSHLHFDHAGGMLAAYRDDAPPALCFSRARVLVGRAAWERALHPHARDRASFIPALQPLLEASGRLEIIDGPASPTLGPDYRFHFSDGHTPGLMLTEVTGARGPVLFAGDLIPGRAWVHLPITMGYDRFPERLIEEKEAVLASLIARGGWLFFTHDPRVCMGRVVQDDRGRYGTADELAACTALAI